MNDPPRNDLDLIYQAILENRRLLLRLLGETEQNAVKTSSAVADGRDVTDFKPGGGR
jgi:hypothetical protein